MIEVIVFSHRRQLQLHAYLESLIKNVYPRPKIHVIYPSNDDYTLIQSNFKRPAPTLAPAQFHREHNGFDATFRDVIDSVESRYMMFGCDDVTWTREVDMFRVCRAITPDVIGFSLRLGDHIKPKRVDHHAPKERKWKWIEKTHHWGYPFELMGTVYRTSDIDDLLALMPKIGHPNHLESTGNAHFISLMCGRRPYMLRNENASCLAQAVNVVQRKKTAAHGGTDQEDPDLLQAQYQQGFRLDWKAAQGATYREVWSGVNDYWKLINVND